MQVLVEPLRSIRTGRPSITLKVVTAWLMAFVFALPQLFIFVETFLQLPASQEFVAAKRRALLEI